MFFWICLVLFIIIIWAIGSYLLKNYIEILSIPFLLILWFISAFRYHIGNDYDTYVVDFYSFFHQRLDTIFFIERTNTTGREITEQWIIYFCSIFDFNYQMLFVIYSIVTFLLLWIILKDVLKTRYLVFLGIIVFALHYNFMWYSYSIIRQFVAMLICLYCVKYIKNKAFIKFIIGVFFASLWHISAAFFVIAYFIPRKKININIYVVSLCISLLIFYLDISRVGVELIVGHIPGLKFYEGYVLSWIDEQKASVHMFMIYHMILGGLFIKYINNNKYDIYVNMYLLFNIFVPLMSFCTPVLRLSLYFQIVLLVLAPLLYQEINFKRKIVFFLLFVLPLSYSFIGEVYRTSISSAAILGTKSMGNINYELNFDL